MVALIKFFDLEGFLVSLIFQILIRISFHTFLYDSWVAVPSAAVIGFAGNLLIAKINSKICYVFDGNVLLFQKSLNIHIHKSVKQFTEEHNQFCRTLSEYNRFWSRLYFAFLLTLIPINLIWLHQLLFEDLGYEIRLFIGFTSVVWILQIYVLQWCFAYLSKQIHKTTKKLSQLQWRLNGWPFRLHTKLKLMAYFERLSDPKRIGLTLGPTSVVLTVQLFSQVLIELK